MLFKLSLKNIKKSIKDYAIYFFTLILGVAIFYVFNSIDDQTVMLNVSASTYEIIKLMISMLSGVSVFVSFILGFLIIYASRFLMKRRKKEFGIYLTLGMSKGRISKILLIETLIIGLISLGVGLLLGIVMSQGMSILVANLFEADMDKFKFVFSSGALVKTIIYFAIMYLLVMLFNTISVSKCKLITLINAGKVNEKVKIKNPIICIIIFLIGASVLTYAYYTVTSYNANLTTEKLYLCIALGCISTFLIFWSLSGLVLKIVMSLKKLYFKNLNMFVLRQINSKINTTVFSMTVICLMLFLTITVLSSSLSLKNAMTNNLKELTPIDFEAEKELNVESVDERGIEYTLPQQEDSKLTVERTLYNLGFNVKANFKDIVSFNTYRTPNITLRSTMDKESLKEVQESYKFLNYDSQEELIKLSDYNKAAKLLGNNTYTLKDDEYLIIADFDSMVEVRNKSLKNRNKITINGKEYKPKFDTCKDGFITISSNHINTGIIVLPDEALENIKPFKNYLLANYNANSKDGKQNIENKIIDLEDSPYNKNTVLTASSKIAIYEASIGLGAMVTFIGLYLGIIFLITSAAILALKELSESSDNKERYQVLRKIGVSEKMINRSLFSTIFIFFMFPLILAIIHSIFGIMLASKVLETFGNEKLLVSIIMTAILLIIIYGCYFLITYFCSKRIISDNE